VLVFIERERAGGLGGKKGGARPSHTSGKYFECADLALIHAQIFYILLFFTNALYLFNFLVVCCAAPAAAAAATCLKTFSRMGKKVQSAGI